MFNDFNSLKKGVIRLYKVWVLEEFKAAMISKESTKMYEIKRTNIEKGYA
jgi:hypothetical protein